MKLLSYKAKDIKNLIALQLGPKMNQASFFHKKTNNEFVYTGVEYDYIFNMLLTQWSDHYSLDVRLWIRQKKVEKLLQSILGKRHDVTIGNTIERIFFSPDGREVKNGSLGILLIQDQDIEAAVETLDRYFDTIAMLYFNRYDNLEAINDIINNPPFDYSPAHVGGGLADRCMRGLIIAKLQNNPQYNDLGIIYDEAIKKTMSADSIDKYRKVKECLG
ncbi:MAG: hypothetical protein J7621_30635 [Niastella sp.]|nr:hypothetical protein [Niastella sp.]PZR09702.1 MAG: hypothetical protein DI539_21730 [Flavobacterium psychrophilum]